MKIFIGRYYITEFTQLRIGFKEETKGNIHIETLFVFKTTSSVAESRKNTNI